MKIKKTHILAICSTVDFKNFTRRATLEAIYNLHPRMDLLLFNGVRSLTKEKILSDRIPTYTYHKWLPGHFAETNLLGGIERLIRKKFCSDFFNKYDLVFFSDPDQYILLDYLRKNIRIAYLVRDPNVLQHPENKRRERAILDRADLVLATSKNLSEQYLQKYHEIEHPNIYYWPNCVDLELWNADMVFGQGEFASQKKQFPKKQTANERVDKPNKIIGVAGNFGSKRTDYNLLVKIADAFPEVIIEIAGHLNRRDQPDFWEKLLNRKNVQYLGFIPQYKLPKIVSRWSTGMVTDRIDEYATYMHHNKVYQYLAMGVPVVSMKIHDDYNHLHPYVQVAESLSEYFEAIAISLNKSASIEFQKQCIHVAQNHSAQKRAIAFIKQVETLFI